MPPISDSLRDGGRDQPIDAKACGLSSDAGSQPGAVYDEAQRTKARLGFEGVALCIVTPPCGSLSKALTAGQFLIEKAP